MVSNTSWDDKKIEDLLKSMPKVEDHRSQSEIYYQVQKRMRKEKRNYWFIPAAAVAAVLLLSLLLYPSIFSNDQALNESERDMDQKIAMTDDHAADALDTEQDELSAKSFEGESAESDNDNTEMGIGMLTHIPSKTALYQEQLSDQSTAITYAVPDEQAQNIVPVTITVPSSKEVTWVEQYNNHVDDVPYEELGLNGEYLPYKGEVSIASDNVLQLDLVEGHPYSAGSASNVNLLNSLNYTFADSPFEKVKLTTNGAPGMDFGNFGNVEEHILKKKLQNPFFIYKKTEDSKALLAPYMDNTFSTIQEAFNAMKEDIETHDLRGPLKDIELVGVSENELELTVEFGDELLPDTDESMLAIEAILLTAKNYGFETVVLKHPSQVGFAGFLFNEPIRVPIAPNYLEQY
ncbi:hypothetical protein GCM10008967_41910 [Bacillus carboniphilus]|uniref:Sigma-X negative effector n=1 Tax=Bacillus carboniphilus TaxID=86663 RepID=A0ABP3GJC1_9BACI